MSNNRIRAKPVNYAPIFYSQITPTEQLLQPLSSNNRRKIYVNTQYTKNKKIAIRKYQ